MDNQTQAEVYPAKVVMSGPEVDDDECNRNHSENVGPLP
jgi:hypothetical protein